MVESLSIKNFRFFENLELHGLRRINILVGRNASGKTAFLESIFLAAGGSPELAIRLRLWRGMGPGLQISLDRPSYESLWKDFFYRFDQSRAISIQLIGSPSNTRSVTIAYKDQATLTLPLDKQPFEGAMIIPITFEWKNFKGETFPVDVRITKEGLNIKGGGESVPCAFFSTSFMVGNPTESASRFSELSKKKREKLVVDALKQHYPYVEGLSVETSGGITMLYAAINNIPEKVPLGIVSGGVNKLVSLLVAVANYSQGVVLIDELENGFYHAMLPQVWCSLLQFCKEHDTQLFVATHSLECLRSVLPCIRGNEQEFSLLRTEKETNQCVARIFGGRQLESAIEQEVELR